LIGTLYFGASLSAALIGDLTTAQGAPPRLVRRERGHGRPADLGWWIAVVNQVGSALFMAAAIAAFLRPRPGTSWPLASPTGAPSPAPPASRRQVSCRSSGVHRA
jgi:hypothetical protein